MTTYSVSGATLTLLGDGNTNSGNILANASFNPITGAMGPTFVKIDNSSSNNVATVSWVPESTTYEYANLSGTASGSGANATFDITVTHTGYAAAINLGGDGYANAETITILGNLVGGSTTANDVTVTVTSIGNVGNTTGVITSVSVAGTEVWPQGTLTSTPVLPNSTAFVQVNGQLGQDTYFTGNCATGNMFITPVQILG